MDKRPDPLHLPPDLNPHAIDLWFKACEDLPTDPINAWKQAIGRFVDLAHAKNLAPFLKVGNRNVAIRNFLYQRRKKIVQFLDYTGLLQNLNKSIRIKRKIIITDYGFEILVFTTVPIRDRNFVKNIQRSYKSRFSLLRDRQRHYNVKLDPAVTFFVFEHYYNLFEVGYSIKCPMHPDYEGGYEKSDYILNHIWKPLYNAFRSRRDPNQIMHL